MKEAQILEDGGGSGHLSSQQHSQRFPDEYVRRSARATG